MKLVKRNKHSVISLIDSRGVMYNMMTSLQYCSVYLKVAQGVDLKISHHKENFF